MSFQAVVGATGTTGEVITNVGGLHERRNARLHSSDTVWDG
ncbi:MAG: hypothetical protein ACYCZP_02655 [Acidimicrobiales bacterium]